MCPSDPSAPGKTYLSPNDSTTPGFQGNYIVNGGGVKWDGAGVPTSLNLGHTEN